MALLVRSRKRPRSPGRGLESVVVAAVGVATFAALAAVATGFAVFAAVAAVGSTFEAGDAVLAAVSTVAAVAALAVVAALVVVCVPAVAALAAIAGSTEGRLVGYGLAVLFIRLAVLLIIDMLASSRPGSGTESELLALNRTGRPRGTEWAFVTLTDGLAATMTATGVLEARSTGDPTLLVASGIALLCSVGPTMGVVRRWRSSRR